MPTVPRQPPSPSRPGADTMATQPSRLSPGAQAKYHTEAEWKDMQPFISSMYASGMQQKELMGALAERGFPITPAQLKKRIRDWNLQRKVTKAEYLDLLRQTGSGVQKASVTKKGRPVAHRNLARASQRFAADLQLSDSDRSSTRSPSVSSGTMSPNSSTPSTTSASPDQPSSTSSSPSPRPRSPFFSVVMNEYPEPADEEIVREDLNARLHGVHESMVVSVSNPTTPRDGLVRRLDETSLRALRIDNTINEIDHPTLLRICLTRWKQAKQYYYDMRPKVAEQLQRSVVNWLTDLAALDSEVVHKKSPLLVSSMQLLACTLDEQAKYAEAEKCHGEHCARAANIHGGKAPESLASQNHLATMYMHTGRYEQALEQAEAAHELQCLVGSEADPFDKVYCQMTIGGIKFRTQHYEEAQRIFERIKPDFIRLLGEHGIFVMRLEQEQARCLFESGDLDGAKALYISSIEKQRRVLGQFHHEPLNGDVRLARVLTAKGEYEEAGRLLTSVIDIYDERHTPADPMTVRARLMLADVLEGRGDVEAALGVQQLALHYNDNRLQKCPWILKGVAASARRLFDDGRHKDGIDVQEFVVWMSEFQKELPEVQMGRRNLLSSMRERLASAQLCS